MSDYERDPTTGNLNLISGMRSLDECKVLMLELCYPVGSIYTSTNNVSPQTFLGGTWTQIKDTFLLTAGDTYVAGTTGGNADAIVPYHTHTQNAHSHPLRFRLQNNQSGQGPWYGAQYGSGNSPSTYTGNVTNMSQTQPASVLNDTATNQYAGTNGNTVGANMPPYKVVYAWERTA